jgi:hypothetical protein
MKIHSVRNIELDQIKSDADVEALLSEVQQPDVTIYVFWPKGAAINPLIGACIRRKQFEKLAPENYWYTDPNSDQGFIRIERNPELGSQKEIQEAQLMFYRAELKLPKRGRLAIILDRRKNQALSDGEAQPKTEIQHTDQHINPSTSQVVSEPSQAGRRGRIPKVDWDGSIKGFVFQQLDHHSWPIAGDPEWSCQADVERAVAGHIQTVYDLSVSESVVRDHTRRLMSEWQRQKAGK